MKVNTDGVLLGALMTIRPEDRTYLDVGTGTHIVIEPLCRLLKRDVLIKAKPLLAVNKIPVGDHGNIVFLPECGRNICRRVNNDLKRSHIAPPILCAYRSFGGNQQLVARRYGYSLSHSDAKYNLFLPTTTLFISLCILLHEKRTLL